MPHLEAEINDFKGSKCFASIDFVSGYWQLPLAEDSWTCCGVVTPNGVLVSKRVLPGLTNSGAHFQRSVEPCFAELRMNLKAWLDDFSLYGKEEEDLLNVLERFLSICAQKNLFLSARKSILFTKEMTWCGRVITPDGYKMEPRRLEGLKDMAFPNTADELAEFVYCTRWMSVCIPDFARRIAPLVELLDKAYKKSGRRTKKSIKNIKLRELSWGATHTKSFESLQESLRDAVRMSYVDPKKVICVFTDASDKFWAGIVTQTNLRDLSKPIEQQRHEPLAFLGAAFRGAQINWSTFEKESFAIFQTFERMDYMLETQNRIHVFTDHRNLLFVFAPLALEPALGRHIVSKVQRWALYLSRFSYAIEHVRGELNVCADMLTRWVRGNRNERSAPRVCSLLLEEAEQLMPRPKDLIWPDIETFLDAQAAASEHPKGLAKDQDDGLWKRGNRIWVPAHDAELQLKVLVISHAGVAGHRGQDATLSILRESFWWPKMESSVNELVQGCLHCIATRTGGMIRRPLGSALHGSRPNEVIHMDYLYMGPSVTDATYLLVIKDDFSSFTWLWPTSSASSEAAADALSTWIGSFGSVEWLISDQGSHFKSELLRTLTADTHTQHHFTTAYSPWANGTVERVCREVLRTCRALLSEWQLAERDWPAVTECVQSVMNQAPLRRLGQRQGAPSGVYRSPLEVFTGHKPVRPLLRALPVAMYSTARSENEIHTRQIMHTETLQKAMAEMHREVSGLISKSRRRRIEEHNRRTNVFAASFDVGDFVLLRRAVSGGHKLSSVWTGPRRIVQCKSDLVFVVQNIMNAKLETVHARRLLKYRADMDGKPATKKLVQAAAHSTARYQVIKEICGIREEGNELAIQIEWDGLPDTADRTWEPLFQVNEDVPTMLEEFLRNDIHCSLRKKARRRLHMN